jgi:ketosteroid isomerase-like protein
MILLAAPALAFGEDEDAKAMAAAKETLDRGAELFDKRDAKAMAATFLEDAEILLIKHDSDSGRIVIDARRGRAEIEKAYDEIFKDRAPEHRCRNTVESARFLAPDLLLIRGKFSLNVDQDDSLQFVQVRAREGDHWKVVTMQLLELPDRNP